MIDAKAPCASTRHLLLTGEAETLQSVSANRREARETAEAKFTLANAVRVAGPDRILFGDNGSSVVGRAYSACLVLQKWPVPTQRFFASFAIFAVFAVNKSAALICY